MNNNMQEQTKAVCNIYLHEKQLLLSHQVKALSKYVVPHKSMYI